MSLDIIDAPVPEPATLAKSSAPACSASACFAASGRAKVLRRALLATAVALATTIGTAQAASITGSYSVTTENPTQANGGPVITDNLAASFTQSLQLNSWTPAAAELFVTLAPNPGSGHCTGTVAATAGALGCFTPTTAQKAGDLSWNSTETDNVTFQFTLNDGSGPKVFSETGVFTAKYGGNALPCANNSPAGNTDCFIWNGSSPNNGTGTLTVPITFNDHAVVQVKFGNAEDWNITPTLDFELTAAAVPEPASLALLGAGIIGLGFTTFRRRRA